MNKNIVNGIAVIFISVNHQAIAVGMEEVLVEARQREESLQHVPLSETAFSSTQILDAKIDRVDDFIALTPNITLVESQGPGVSFITVRGISQVRNAEPPVAVLVDGVLQVSSRQLTQELFDVEQIEVIRGPQGALYGRNATGGAILINTKQPTNETEGYIRLGLGAGDEERIQASLSGAIVDDTLLYRLSGSYIDRKGYFDNNYLNTEADFYEDKSFRGLLKWQVSDDLLVDLRINSSDTDSGAVNFQYQPALFDSDKPCFTNDDLIFAGTSNANTVSRDFCANNLGFAERDIDEFTLNLDYDLGFAVLTSTSSSSSIAEYTGSDQFPYTAAVGIQGIYDGIQVQYVDIDTWSQELRLVSNNEDRLRWAVGAYYLKTDRFISSTTSEDNRMGIVRVEKTPAFNNLANPTVSFFADDNENISWAVFGSTNYDISKKLELSLALRYDKDKRDQQVSPFNTSGTAGTKNTETFDSWQPKVSLRYLLDDDVQLYGSWGQGFRSGQFNQNGVAQAALNSGLVGVQDVVGEEKTNTLEIGIKSELFDNRLRLNMAIYHTIIDGSQYFVFLGDVGAQVLVNIDEVEVLGGELELAAEIYEGLDFYASLGVTDTEITDYALNPSAEGNIAPYVPEYTFNIGSQYRFNMTDYLNGFARVDYERRGAQFWDPENSTDRSPLSLVNARLGVESTDDIWSVIASVNNLTDEKYNSEWALGGFSHPAEPKVWSLDFRYNF